MGVCVCEETPGGWGKTQPGRLAGMVPSIHTGQSAVPVPTGQTGKPSILKVYRVE